MAYGDGTVAWNPRRGKYVGRYEKHDGRAKRVRGWVTAETEAEAWKKLRKAQSISATLPAYDGRLRLDTFLRRWLDEMQSGVRPRTADGHRSRVETNIIPAIGGYRLVELRAPAIADWRDDLLASGLAPRTVNHNLSTLRYALGKAVEWRMVDRNEASFVKGPHVPDGDVRPLTTTEARSFLAHVKGDEWEAMYLLALALGMRQSEILGLRWQDVTGSQLEVRKVMVWLNGRVTLEDPKTERSHRTLTLPARIVEALARRESAQRQERLGNTAWNPRWTAGYDLVFSGPNGYAIERTRITRAFQRHLTDLGLRKVPFHSTRHSATGWMTELGMTMREIADVLGHSRPSVTSDVYSHLGTAATERAASLLDAALG